MSANRRVDVGTNQEAGRESSNGIETTSAPPGKKSPMGRVETCEARRADRRKVKREFWSEYYRYLLSGENKQAS